MATKRPHSAIHPSRLDQVPSEPKRKRQKPDHITGKSFKKAHTVHELKSQIRSLKRLLEHNDGLPPTVRVDKERALQSAQYELAETERAKKRSEVIGKWHKVRFFERQKASKRLKRLRKEVRGLEEGQEREGVERRAREAEVDVNYAMYFPLEEDYVPLFARRRKEVDADEEGGEESPEPAEVVRQGDTEMWERVWKCMQDGTLDALRNGKLTGSQGTELVEDDASLQPAAVVMPKKKRPKKEKLQDMHGNRRERRKAAAEVKADSEGEGDDSFFEAVVK